MTRHIRRRSGYSPVPTMHSPLGPCNHDAELTAHNCVFCMRDRLLGLVQAVRSTVPDWEARFLAFERAKEQRALELEAQG